ncbi:ATP-dependent 6-phosphofructokinase 3 [Amborella trichopoda]|nr:ATP-dependent 6-phosphofructokinase 3 [Amborella trichopoda]|eukprot:XP_020525724.1 ATP-dependent 6-phosphofructokinase 3 [Amborella trichopoda]
MNSPTQWFQLVTDPLPSLCSVLFLLMYVFFLVDIWVKIWANGLALLVLFVFLSPQSCTFAYKLGGTIIGTSRGGHDTPKIVDSIQDRGINQKIGRHGLKVSVAGIPKTIDNDIAVIDKSFGFDTAVEEAQRAMNAAHVEVGSVDNGLGIVKLMGRYSEFIAMYATLASRDVDCCLIPESPFYLEGEGGLFDFIEKRLKENGHMVIVLEEGAWQELVAQSMRAVDETDASGNQLHHDVGLWLAHNVKVSISIFMNVWNYHSPVDEVLF